MARPTGLLTRIITAAADRLAQHPSIPAESREALSAAAVSVFECAINDMLGADSVRFGGWAIAPSQRNARRERIIEAIRAGHSTAEIASRELVSVRWVNKLRSGMGEPAGTLHT